MNLSYIKNSLKIIIIGLVLGLSLGYVDAAWVGPTATAPLGNASTPLNISANSQYKTGALSVGGLIVAYSGVSLGNTVTTGNACTPNGLVGVTSGGFLAICKSLVWTAVAKQTQ